MFDCEGGLLQGIAACAAHTESTVKQPSSSFTFNLPASWLIVIGEVGTSMWHQQANDASTMTVMSVMMVQRSQARG